MFGFFKQRKDETVDYKKILENYQDTISSSMKFYIQIKAKKANGLELWQSKFQGLPYLTEKDDYPKNSKGKYLYLIAQINFEEVPKLEPYPEKGILQFWIATDDLYGLDFDHQTKQDSFKIIYYPDIQKENLVKDFSFLPTPEYFPFADTYA
ncbi:MAG: YwqG family protein, partial [Pseudomonadota bacterium]